MSALFTALFAPGFFVSGPVHAALLAGAVTALVTGAVGTFTVIRRQAFAGHATGEVASTGGSAALLGGLNPLWGYLGIALIVAGAIEAVGAQRPRVRDLATGLVLGAGLGVAALFLYIDTTQSSTTGAAVTILFGSLFAVSASVLPAIVALSVVALGIVVAGYRMLLLSSLSPDLAAARGVPIRLISLAYLVSVAVAVSLAAETVGAILATALLIGPPATALRLTSRPELALGLAGLLGVFATWLGTVLAYDSYYWPPQGRSWPPSFFIVALVFAMYLLSGAIQMARQRSRGRRPDPPAVQEAAA
ncbi:MAG: metal ABC transporter permease [Candidatus Dormiibacterota bacterium]